MDNWGHFICVSVSSFSGNKKPLIYAYFNPVTDSR